MANYQLKLTPDVVNQGTEGSMDEWIVDGASVQRTAYLDVFSGDGTKRKIMARLADGGTFDDSFTTWDDNEDVVSL